MGWSFHWPILTGLVFAKRCRVGAAVQGWEREGNVAQKLSALIYDPGDMSSAPRLLPPIFFFYLGAISSPA